MQFADACQQVNIYEFIRSLPEDSTGRRKQGRLAVCGQKQRIASRAWRARDIADGESALTESEGCAGGADKAARGRTTVAVAHRLSTIRTPT